MRLRPHPFPSAVTRFRHLGLAVTALAFAITLRAEPTLSPISTSNLGPNQVTLTLQSSGTGNGYFTFLEGASAPAGNGFQTKDGKDANDSVAPHFGSLSLTANTAGTYTVRNLKAATTYKVCFTAEDGSPAPAAPVTATFTTAAAGSLTSTWTAVGSAGFSAGQADYLSLAFAPDGTPYLAFTDGANSSKSTVMSYSAGSWSTVGSAGFSVGIASYVSLAVAPDGTPWVGARDETQSFPVNWGSVWRFSGGSWNVVEASGSATEQTATYLALAFSPNGRPHVAFQSNDDNKAWVRYYDGSFWQQLDHSFSAGAATHLSLVFAPGGSVYVAYRDGANSDKATVLRSTDYASGNGTTWNAVGTAGFSAGAADYVRLAIAPDGTPYVAYMDASAGDKVTVMRYSSGSWSTVGSAGFSSGVAVNVSLAIAPDGAPWIAYTDSDNGYKATVMKYSAGSWSVVGGGGISAGNAFYLALAFAPDGTPYLAYKDVANSNKATVMKLFANATPAIANLGGDTLAFIEDSGAQVLDHGSAASVTDTDNPASLNGGNVTVSIVTNRVSGEDVLSIRNQGTGAGQIGVSGSNVTYAGTTIGTFTGGSGTNDLVVTLNASSTLTNVGALLQNLTYNNTNSGNPSTSARTVRVTVTDDNGGTSANADLTVNVSAVNDSPTVSGLPANRSFTEDTQANFDLSASAFSDADSTDVTVVLTASAGTFGLAAPGGITLSTLSGQGTSTITIAGTVANVNQYLDIGSNVTYTPEANLTGSPAASVTVTANDGNGSGNVSLGTIMVNITAVNDAPSFTAGATLVAMLEDASSPAGETITNLLGANFSDLENNFAGLAVTASAANSGTEGQWQYSTDSGTNWFDIGSVSTSGALLLNTGTKLRFLPLANFSGTPGSLTVHAVDDSVATTFTSGSTRQTFDTTSDDATSKVAASGVAVGTSITAVNDAPTLTATGLSPMFAEGGSAVDLFGTVSASTVDSAQTFAALTLTVTNVADGANEILAIGGTDVALTNGNSGTLAGIGSFSVSVSGGTATISTTGLTRDNTQMGALVDGITYRNTATPPATTARAVTLTGIQDSGGTANSGVNAASLSLVSTVSIDLAPTITGRTVPGDGTYKTGQNLDFTVTYSENVTVNTGGGTPYLAVTLATGGSVQAAYHGGTGTTTLTFRYTVASGNLDADGIAVASAITLNSGTIKDGTGNDAAITSLGFGSTAAVLVDGVAPTVSSSNRQTPSGASTSATSVVYRVTFAEGVTGVDTADFTLTKTGTADGTIASINAVSSTVYDVTVNTITGNGTLRLDLNNSGTGIADTPATNAIAAGYTSGQTYTIDSAAPTLSTIARQAPTTVHTAAASATWRVTFAEGVTGVDTTDFTLTQVSGTGAGTLASVTPVSTSVYDVVVNGLTGQGRLRLDLKSTGTGIADLAGNALADGGFTGGEFYLVGSTSVFDSLSLTVAANVTTSLASANKPAQRFTTAAGQPLTLSSVVAKLNSVTATPTPVVKIYTDNAGAPGTAVGTALTNPASLAPNALNVWTGSVVLSASTTYWIVFEETVSAYAIDISTLTTGGSGNWLTNPDYLFRYGANAGTTQTGALLLALGATSTPSISSTLTAGATVGTAFSYTITATNTPTSFAATGLPAGLSVNTSTGAITGTPSRAGTSNVSLTATNGSSTGPSSTLVLTVGQGTAAVTLGSLTQAYTGSPRSVTATTSPGGLSVTILYNSLATAPTAVGTYSVSASIDDADYSGFESGTLIITKAVATVSLSSLASTYDGTPKSATATTSPASLQVTITYDGATTAPTTAGSYAVVATINSPSYTGSANGTLTIAPAVTVPPVVTPGSSTQLSAVDSGLSAGGHWERNGTSLVNTTGLTLTLPDVQPPTAGLYTYSATAPAGGIATSEPVIVGLSTTEKVIGTGDVVGTDIVHPNGNVYDQVLLEGTGASLTADKNKVTRISFIDLTNDIVQVEFSGAGTLSVVMDDASSPTPPANYNQPGVDYVRGHAGLVITGANETSNLSVFSIGRVTAVNQSLFKTDVTYDGVADIAFVAIQSTNGKFGGLRTGNAHYFATKGFTGLYAPGVAFAGPVNIGDVTAFDDATPVLICGDAGTVHLTGGDLAQDNGQPVKVSGITRVTFENGTTSQGITLPAQANRARLVTDGVDVTDLLVRP